MQKANTSSHDKLMRYLFIAISALLLIIMPLISKDYGQSGDEWLQIFYGQDIYNYFFNGDKQALDYSNKTLQYQGIEYYGGLFDYVMEILHRWMPSIALLHLRHFFNALTGAFLMIFTGLFAYRISNRNWLTGVMALLLIAFSPRIFGESMNNPKDIPFACGFIVAVYSLLALIQDIPAKIWKHTIGIAIGFTLAFGVRPAGGLLLIVTMIALVGLYYFLQPGFKENITAHQNKLLKRTVLMVIGALIVGYIIGLLAWPWGLQEPFTRPLESLKQMTNIKITIRVFFEGVFRPNNNMPWYYELKWIAISSPLIVIAGVLLYFLLGMKGKNKYGWAAFLFVAFAAFFTPLYMIYKKSSVHDTWRHLFFIYPFWVSMAAMSITLIGDYIKNEKLRWLPLGISVAGLLPAIIWTFQSHPNQYVYFNESVGGVKGAFGYYDIDYYQNSGLQDGKWIMANGVKPDTSKKILVASNMLGFEQYFAKDTNRLAFYYVRYNERHKKDWDYYVTYSRFISPEQLQNDKWPPANVVYEVKEDDVVLSAVLTRKSKAGIIAAEALERKDFATAVQQYEAFLKTDNSDESAFANYGIALASIGNIDGAIGALLKASELDPGNPQFYSILAQLYNAKGDAASAQKATNQANAIMMHEQELMAPPEE